MTADPQHHSPLLPQPVGVFGWPAGLLLLAPLERAANPDHVDEREVHGVETARAELVAGRLPSHWPDALRVHEMAHADQIEAAVAACADDPAGRFNRWVLDPEASAAAGLGPEEIRSALPVDLQPLVDVVAHTLGLCAAPEPTPVSTCEVAALVLAARAAAQVEVSDPGAIETLLEAAEAAGSKAPALAGVLRANAGTLLADRGADQQSNERAFSELSRAASELAGTDLADVRAEVSLRLGALAQERSTVGAGDARALLQEAMGHYYDGLKLVGEEDAPYLWAMLNMNLATAQLAVPMTQATDQLRLGVATQALRACRRIFTADAHPGPWSTATLNLANALVYTPSTHQADNLVEAVGLYEEVLGSGVRANDALGTARLRANLGNTLAHLGLFEEARPHLVEARFVFEEHLDHDAAASVRGVLDEIAKQAITDPDADLAALAQQAEQMSRVPVPEGDFTAGMGVTVMTGPDAAPPPKPKVTVVAPSSRPTDLPGQEQST